MLLSSLELFNSFLDLLLFQCSYSEKLLRFGSILSLELSFQVLLREFSPLDLFFVVYHSFFEFLLSLAVDLLLRLFASDRLFSSLGCFLFDYLQLSLSLPFFFSKLLPLEYSPFLNSIPTFSFLPLLSLHFLLSFSNLF